MPLISVIVPVYRVEPYIRRCIDSILSQTFTDFDMILIDDGSPDDCPAICDEYALKDNRIHVIHQKNGGLSAARNAGIDYAFANSDSEWISFVDSDDWVHPSYLKLLHQSVIENGANASACFNSLDKEFLPEKRINSIKCNCYDFEDFFSFKRNGFNRIIACAKLYKKDLFLTERFPVGKLNEDLFTVPRILYNCKIVIVEVFLYHYYQSEDSIMRKQWNIGRLDEVEASEELIRFFRSKRLYKAEKEAIYRYFWVMNRQREEIRSLSEVNKRMYRYITLKYKLSLFRYRKAFSKKELRYRFEREYPKAAWMYWTCIGIMNKLRKVAKNA